MRIGQFEHWSLGRKFAAFLTGFIVLLGLVSYLFSIPLQTDSEFAKQNAELYNKAEALSDSLIGETKTEMSDVSVAAFELGKTIPSELKHYYILLNIGNQVLVFALVALLFRFLFVSKNVSFYSLKSATPMLYVLTPLLLFNIIPIEAEVLKLGKLIGFNELSKMFESSLSEMILGYSIFIPYTESELWVSIVVVGLLPAIGEELLFRGTVQKTLIQHFGNPHNAIFITALVFALVHLQWSVFLGQFMLGVILGYIYFWGRSLFIPILFHFCNNALTMYSYYLYGQNIDQPGVLETENATGGPMALVFSLVFAGMILFIFNLDYKRWFISRFIK